MGNSRSRSRRTVRSGALLACALALTGALASPYAAFGQPPSARIEATRAEAEQARVRLDELSADLEERTEDFLEVQAALDETRQRIKANEAELELAEADLGRAQALLNARAASIYRTGGLDVIGVVLGVNDFGDLLNRLDWLARIGASDASMVSRVKSARARLESVRTGLETRRAEQLALKRDAQAKYAHVERATEEQKRYLASLDAQLKRLIAEERERQERLARERAEAAARAAREGAAARTAASRGGREFDETALGSPHPQVVAIARRYVGRTPYVWGGVTPAGFDCSGLVLYCYREIGINLPRTSRQQYRVGAFIPPNRLELLSPGDLVFFGREGDPGRVHHVGIYVGDGDMIHAPQRGEYVSVTSLYGRIERRGDYVGAVRP